MIESGFDEEIVPMILSGDLIYGGYSAALLAAGTSLYGTELVDDMYTIPDGYTLCSAPTKGIGLIDFFLIPHEGSTAPWACNINQHIELLRSEGYAVKTLVDGAVYIRNGEEEGVWK